MSKFFKIVMYFLSLLIVAGGFFAWHNGSGGDKGDSRERGEKLLIDYTKFEELSRKRPDGEKYLNFIRDNEAELYDEDPSNDADAYINIGFHMRALGDDATAISAYQKGLELEPENNTGLNNIASSYLALGNLEKAEEYYRKLTQALPGSSAAYINLAEVHKNLYPEDEGGFLGILKEGAEIAAAEDKANLLSYLGTYFRDKGNTTSAIEYFEQLVKLFPKEEIYKAELEELKKL